MRPAERWARPPRLQRAKRAILQARTTATRVQQPDRRSKAAAPATARLFTRWSRCLKQRMSQHSWADVMAIYERSRARAVSSQSACLCHCPIPRGSSITVPPLNRGERSSLAYLLLIAHDPCDRVADTWAK